MQGAVPQCVHRHPIDPVLGCASLISKSLSKIWHQRSNAILNGNVKIFFLRWIEYPGADQLRGTQTGMAAEINQRLFGNDLVSPDGKKIIQVRGFHVRLRMNGKRYWTPFGNMHDAEVGWTPDGVPSTAEFRVTLLGTATSAPRPDRFGPSTLVEAGSERLVFNSGRSCTTRLWQLKINKFHSFTLNTLFGWDTATPSW